MPTRILIIDDDPACLGFYGALLKRHGYIPLTAKDGQAGFALARRYKPNLILLDLSLPGQNGIDVLRMIRADERTAILPVVLMTGVPDPSGILASACRKVEGSIFLRKPASPAEILRAIRRALKARPGPDNRCEPEAGKPLRLRVDQDRRRVWVGGRLIPSLGPRRFRVLIELMKTPNGLSREALLASAWGPGCDLKTVDRTVQRLRRDLVTGGRDAIVALPGGYRLVG